METRTSITSSKPTRDQLRQLRSVVSNAGPRAGKLLLKKVRFNTREDLDRVLSQGNLINDAMAEAAIVKVNELLMVRKLQAVPFNPAEFCGTGWEYAETQDQRSLTLSTIDAALIKFETFLNEGESIITGEERLKRAKELSLIRLDARFFMALWKEEGHKTLEWFHATQGVTRIEFLGSPLCNPDGYRYSLVLYRHDDGTVAWNAHWVDNDRPASRHAAVLES